MCQMCDEYENELVRMGLIEDARVFHAEREREHAKALAFANRAGRPDKPQVVKEASEGGH
jgi:hypothetical protein